MSEQSAADQWPAAPVTARVRGNGQLTLPKTVREALMVVPGDTLEFEVVAPGVVTLRSTGRTDDQAWFWTGPWQTGEREASAELAAGQATFYEDADAMFHGLGLDGDTS